MNSEKNIVAGINHERPVLLDCFLANSNNYSPVLVFFHGTKGFKDWGYWPHMYTHFNHEGITLITVNYSHNGVRFPVMDDISDTEAFAQNTISMEWADMKIVMDWIMENAEIKKFDTSNISFCGHSRGGANVINYASTDSRVSKVIAWAPVSDYKNTIQDFDPETWREQGYVSLVNARTQVEWPLNYSYYEDLMAHADDFHVLHNAAMLKQPVLLIHGTLDESVSITNSHNIHEQCLHALLVTIQNAGHTFGNKHPWDLNAPLPHELKQLLENTIEFIKD